MGGTGGGVLLLVVSTEILLKLLDSGMIRGRARRLSPAHRPRAAMLPCCRAAVVPCCDAGPPTRSASTWTDDQDLSERRRQICQMVAR
jgi:hypothetical protein